MAIDYKFYNIVQHITPWIQITNFKVILLLKNVYNFL